jgi:DNA-binding XRE family transcriptional regulator
LENRHAVFIEECGDMDGNGNKRICRNRVRELRENRLMTQAQLARKAKVALRTIHSVEKGMNCRMDTKRKILLALGLRFEDKDQVFPPTSATFGEDRPGPGHFDG